MARVFGAGSDAGRGETPHIAPEEIQEAEKKEQLVQTAAGDEQ